MDRCAPLTISQSSSEDEIRAVVGAWVAANVPETWREAARRGGWVAIREVRSRADYEAWYPTFAASGLVVATWPTEYLGLKLTPAQARAAESVLELGLTDACRAGAKELVSVWGHPDQQEGPRAFAEKRGPVWQPLTDT